MTVPWSAPKTAKKARPIMFATRSGTMVCVSRVATKKIAPIRAHALATLILASTISSSRGLWRVLVMLFGSRPS